MTDPKEIERVRAIHAQLDAAAARNSDRAFNLRLTLSGITLHYTAEEVRAWPEVKASLVASLRTTRAFGWAYCPAGFGADYSFRPGVVPQDNSERSNAAQDSIARGLVMYPEMLNDARRAIDDGCPTSICGPHALNGVDQRCPEHGRRCANPDCDALCAGLMEWTHFSGANRYSYCCRQCCAAHHRPKHAHFLDGPVTRGIDPASDAPDSFKAKAARFNDTEIAALTQALPANVAARKRMVAALAQEMRKPVTPRYPHEGRSERALLVTNGGR